MKFAFCVEDPTDQEVLRGIMAKVLDQVVEPADVGFRIRGLDQALNVAGSVAKRAHRDGLDGAVFAIDNDGEPVHAASHQFEHAECRMCRLRRAAAISLPLSWPRPHLPPLQFFFAVPTQIIETWLLHMRGDYAFKNAGDTIGSDRDGRVKLKKALYGTESPDSRTMAASTGPIIANFNPDALANLSPSFRDFRDQLTSIRSSNALLPSSVAASQE